MLTIFKRSKDKSPPRIPPNLENVKRTITLNLNRFTNHWHNMNWAVPSDHILVHVLNYLNVISSDPLTIYREVSNQIPQIVSSLGIVSSLFYGRVQPTSWFFGEGNKEILLQQPFDDSINQIFTKNYKDWEPIKVIRAPFTTFDMQLANGKPRKSNETGLCIIKIDIALLYTQYRMWWEDTETSVYADGTRKSVMNFIHSYPIVNMMYSQIELAWYTRFRNICFGLNNGDTKSDDSLAMVSNYSPNDQGKYNNLIDQILFKLYDDLLRTRGDMDLWLSWIPGIQTKNLKTFLKPDNILESQQNELALELIYAPWMEWLFYLCIVTDNKTNGAYLNEYRQLYRAMNSSRIFGTIRGLKNKEIKEWYQTHLNSLAMKL